MNSVDDAKLVEELAGKLFFAYYDKESASFGFNHETDKMVFRRVARAALAFARARIPALLGMTGEEMVERMWKMLRSPYPEGECLRDSIRRDFTSMGILPPPPKTPGEEFAEEMKKLITINEHEMRILARAFDAKAVAAERGGGK